MAFKVGRETLLQSLQAVEAGLSTREIIEQSSCFVFKDGQVITFNDEVSVTAPSGLPKSIKGAVPAKNLITLLNQLKDDELDLDVTAEALVLKGKGKEYEFRMEADILLQYQDVEKPGKWQSLPENFVEAVGMTSQCVSRDVSQFALSCLHIHPKYIEACDNYQMARYLIDSPIKESLLVRGSSIRHILTLGVKEFSVTETWIHFRSSKAQISCRRFEDTYKDIGKFLNVNGKPATLPRGLAAATKNVGVFSAEFAEDNHVMVELRAGKMRITGTGVTGKGRERLTAKYDGPDMAFLISPVLLEEIVARHHDVHISDNSLKVKGGSYQYVTVLGDPKEVEKASTDRAKKADPKGKRGSA